MPRRSNDFQRLIRRIYEQIQPHGATVTESALLQERSGATVREVDVLVEFAASDVLIRMAVECRDHSRPADIGWIDELIGKYRELPVHRIVAVARAGFTPAAKAKASANEIETRSLREGLSADWPSDLLELGMARMSADLQARELAVNTTPPWPDNQQPDSISISGVTTPYETFMQDALRQMHGKIGDLIKSELGSGFQTLKDLQRTMDVTWEVQVPNARVSHPQGSIHQLLTMTVRCRVALSYETLPVRRALFGNVGVTSAVDDKAIAGPATLIVTQRPGHPLSETAIFRPGEEE